MSAWWFKRNPKVPSDAEFESLRRRYVSLRDYTLNVQPWGSALLLFAAVGLAVVFPLVPSAPNWSHSAAWGFVLVAFGVAVSRCVGHRRMCAREAHLIHDRLVRRPDRCMCSVCDEALEVDAEGRAHCTACGVDLDRAGWPLTLVPEFGELDALTDTQHRDVLHERERLGRVMFWMAIAPMPLVLGFLVALIFALMNPNTLLLLCVPVIAFGLGRDALRHRLLALSALLCTRPDLWDPTRTHLPISELEGKVPHSPSREKLVKRARKERVRLGMVGDW